MVSMVSRRTVVAGGLLTAASAALSACGGGDGGSSGGFSFSYLRPTWGPATFTKDGPYQKELEKQAGISVDVRIIPVVDYDTKVQTTLASGDIPDVIWGSGPVTAVWRDAESQGAFLPINDYLDEYPAIREAVPKSIWDMLTNDDGELFFVPNLIWPEVPFVMHYRKDLLDQAKIEEPTTIDDFVDVLGQVKSAYPDAVPLTLGYEWSVKDLATSFDTCFFGWEPMPDDPETITPWFVKDSDIDVYFWLQQLHKDGLLDPDFNVSKEPSFAEDKFVAGKAIFLPSHWAGYADLLGKVRSVEPSAELGIAPPLGEFGGNRMVLPVDRGFYVSAAMEDPDRFFEFLNWSLTEGNDFRRWGIKSETYEEKDGQMVSIPDDQRDKGYQGPQLEPLGFLGPFSEKLDWDQMKINFEGADAGEHFDYVRQKCDDYTAQYHIDYRDLTALSETEDKHGTQLFEDNMRQITESAIIDHGATKDAWMEAVGKWREGGGDQIIEEVNQAQQDKSKPNYLEGV